MNRIAPLMALVLFHSLAACAQPSDPDPRAIVASVAVALLVRRVPVAETNPSFRRPR